MKITHRSINETTHTFSVKQKDIREEVVTRDDIEADYKNSKGIYGSPNYEPAYKKVGETQYRIGYAVCPICKREIKIFEYVF